MEENLSRISQLTIKLCTFSICVSSIVFAQTPLVAFVSYQPWPLMVEWYIWKVGWFRVFGCSSSRALSAMPQLTILTLTSLSKTDNICLQASKRQKYATEQINRLSAWIPSSILSFFKFALAIMLRQRSWTIYAMLAKTHYSIRLDKIR